MGTVIEQDLGLGIVEHTVALRRYARFLTRTADQADDLVQDCIARALSRPHLYRPDTNLRGWLFTMLRNIAISQSRKAKIRRSYAAERMAIGSAATPPNQYHRVALTESLRLLKTLRAPERQAVALLGICDLTYQEAAEQSGLNVGTMKSRLSRGRARLRILAEPLRKTA
jgi:RNA polymerase sigma-70 factor (ECF subfamily)